MRITAQDMHAIRILILDLCGVYIQDSKSYLIDSRLRRLVHDSGHSSYTDFVQHVTTTNDASLKRAVVDAITTSETLFFRDQKPFAALQNKILPDLIDRISEASLPKRIRIWSAACSTGQEPYSIAMTALETIPDISNWHVQVIATDISDGSISKASRGVYSEYEIERGLPRDLLQKYVTSHDEGWQVADHVRSMVSFHRRNLLDSFRDLESFDVIFCRNVAIYFEDRARRSLFERMLGSLNPNGHLFLGSSESIGAQPPNVKLVRHCGATSYCKCPADESSAHLTIPVNTVKPVVLR